MPAILLAGPAVEPLSLAEAKAYLRIDHEAEDALVASLIVAAHATVEALTRRVLIDQSWRLVRDAWPASGLIVAPVNPMREIVSAHVLAADGSQVEVPLAALTLDSARLPALIRVDRVLAPAPGRPLAGIAIDVTAGHGAGAADIPPPLIEAVRSCWRISTSTATCPAPPPPSPPISTRWWRRSGWCGYERGGPHSQCAAPSRDA